MTPKDREHLEKLDHLILNASFEELEKIQEVDHMTQMEGLSLYDIYLDSDSLIVQSLNGS